MTDRPSNADLAAAEARTEAARTALANPCLGHYGATVVLLTAGLRAGLDALGQLREARAAVRALQVTRAEDGLRIERLRRACEVIAKAELYDPATGIIDADVLGTCQEEARGALAGTDAP
jgi:hypothetical protein